MTIDRELVAGHADLPVLVFLHDGLGSLGLWRDFPRLVADALGGPTTFVYSRAGYGYSSSVSLPRPVTYMHDEALEVLPRLLRDNGIERPVLIGHSDGASIAIIHAGAGFAVESLVLLSPHVFVEERSIAGIEAAAIAYESGDLRTRLERHHADVDGAFRGWNDVWLSPEFRDWDITSSLVSITCPVLVIQEEDDAYGTLGQLDAIEGGVSGPVTRLVLPRERPQSSHRLAGCGDRGHRPTSLVSVILGGVTTTHHDVALAELYADFAANGLMPLWTVRGDLMPTAPSPRASRTCGDGTTCCPLADRAGHLVPVGRGGERRAIAYANPGLKAEPYATPTLWAAVQYLGPERGRARAPPLAERVPVRARRRRCVDRRRRRSRRDAPRRPAAHRRMALARAPQRRRTRRWSGSTGSTSRSCPASTRGSSSSDPTRSPIARRRSLAQRAAVGPPGSAAGRRAGCEDVAADGLSLGAHRRRARRAARARRPKAMTARSRPATLRCGSRTRRTAATRSSTMRIEMHRLAAGASSALPRRVGSSVWQVFDGDGVIELDGQSRSRCRAGDVIAVPSWCAMRVTAVAGLDLFVFSDAPVYEALDLAVTP